VQIDLTQDGIGVESVVEAVPALHTDQLTNMWHELSKDGRVVVYTDGACSQNQRSSLRRAGVGVFWGHGNDRNLSVPLPGSLQSNQRAELYAILLALETDSRPLEIRTDSAYARNGCVKGRHAWRRRGWRTRRGVLLNSDLWQKIDVLLNTRPVGHVLFVKVKGHSSAEDVLNGNVSWQDKAGNDFADGLALAGIVPMSVQEKKNVLWRARFLSQLQAMMVDILRVRHSEAIVCDDHSVSSSSSSFEEPPD